jgi:hypothetical protein
MITQEFLQQAVPYIPPTDDAGIASGLVLREVHCALLRGVDGRGLGSEGAEAPRTARLAATDAQAATAWTSCVSKAILNAPPLAVDDDARVRYLLNNAMQSIAAAHRDLHAHVSAWLLCFILHIHCTIVDILVEPKSEDIITYA